MNVTSEHLTGLAVGIGVSAVGFYLYKKNQGQVDEFLRSHGVPIPEGGTTEPTSWTLEELVTEKERLEDLIAERQHATQTEGAEPE